MERADVGFRAPDAAINMRNEAHLRCERSLSAHDGLLRNIREVHCVQAKVDRQTESAQPNDNMEIPLRRDGTKLVEVSGLPYGACFP
jgi:hypothetical protein